MRSRFICFDTCKVRRKIYSRRYPIRVINTDGSSFRIGYDQSPRVMLKLPIDINEISEEEKKIILMNRMPKKVTAKQQVVEKLFNIDEYEDLWK